VVSARFQFNRRSCRLCSIPGGVNARLEYSRSGVGSVPRSSRSRAKNWTQLSLPLSNVLTIRLVDGIRDGECFVVDGRHCARYLSSKGAGSTSVRTVFGTVRLPNPRWNQCDCQSTGKGSFRPLQGWLCGQTTPELLYLEVRWASLIPYGGVARLLEDVLPVVYTKRDDDPKPRIRNCRANRNGPGRGETRVLRWLRARLGSTAASGRADDRWHRWRLCPSGP